MNTRQPFNALASELLASLALAPKPIVGTPSASPTLASYVSTYGGGITSERLALALGYDPRLFAQVDARLQVLPQTIADRLAGYLQRPVAEVVWAGGGRVLRAPAPGLGRRPL